MPDFLTTPTAQAVIAVVVLCVLIALGFYLVSIFRDYAADNRGAAPDVLANLQEMHRKGDISDEEFRTIQSTTHQRSTEPAFLDDSSPVEETPEER